MSHVADQPDRPPRILIVDDDPSVVRALSEALAADGFGCAGAGTATEAAALGGREPFDAVVADVRLPDGSGLDVVRRLQAAWGRIPAVVMTGWAEPAVLSEASRLRPAELLTKPVDAGRLARTLREALARRENYRRVRHRARRLREVARRVNRRRKRDIERLAATCADLTGNCRQLHARLERQELLSRYQTDLLGCENEDDIFCRLFRLFVQWSGPVFGAALLCDEEATLQMIGRFGVPVPDGVSFCKALAGSVLGGLLERPEVTVIDAVEQIDLFPEGIRRMLPGVTLLVVPLMIGEGRMIGMVVLYRKGEQPFTEDDVALAELVASPTAAAAQKT